MSEDILLQLRRANPDLELQYSEDVFNEALISLENICISINNKVLNEIGLHSPERNRNGVLDKELLQETQHNITELKVYVETQEKRLTDDQKLAYDTAMHYAREGKGGLLYEKYRLSNCSNVINQGFLDLKCFLLIYFGFQ